MEGLSSSESVSWFLAGVGSLVPFILVRLAIAMFRRGSGEISIDD